MPLDINTAIEYIKVALDASIREIDAAKHDDKKYWEGVRNALRQMVIIFEREK